MARDRRVPDETDTGQGGTAHRRVRLAGRAELPILAPCSIPATPPGGGRALVRSAPGSRWPRLWSMPELRFPAPPLGNETVLLRPWRAADLPDNLRAFSDPVIQRFSWPEATPFTEDDAHSYFVDQEQARLRGEEVQFAAVDPRDEDEVLGGVSLYAISRARDVPPRDTGSLHRPGDAGWLRARSCCLPGGGSPSWGSLVWS